MSIIIRTMPPELRTGLPPPEREWARLTRLVNQVKEKIEKKVRFSTMVTERGFHDSEAISYVRDSLTYPANIDRKKAKPEKVTALSEKEIEEWAASATKKLSIQMKSDLYTIHLKKAYQEVLDKYHANDISPKTEATEQTLRGDIRKVMQEFAMKEIGACFKRLQAYLIEKFTHRTELRTKLKNDIIKIFNQETYKLYDWYYSKQT